MSGMNIVTLPANMFADKTNLKHLNLSFNYLVSLESQVLESLPRLGYLDLTHNMFMGLDAELLRLGKSSVRERQVVIKYFLFQLISGQTSRWSRWAGTPGSAISATFSP